ncbi:unnamed protein product [Schistosoma rodhaini]|nr:unnamed protein product [Schistosoma rodhaini]
MDAIKTTPRSSDLLPVYFLLTSVMNFQLRLQNLSSNLFKEAQRFTDYNIRSYFERKIDKIFKNLSQVEDANILETGLKKNEELLEVLARQATLNNIYPSGKSVIE